MSFIYDANMEDPAELRRKRQAYLNALQAAPIGNSLGEGIAIFGKALANRIGLSKTNAALSKGQNAAYAMLNEPAAAPVQPAPVAAAPASGDLASLIQATAADVGIDPKDLATAISYETAGTFDPMKKGPRTKWGRHQGLIQFGEPQAKKYGVDWNDPVNSQLGAGKAVARYLKDAGVKPGMGLMDVYSAINAGRVGHYGASDAAAGGAPGTVADKVNNQMSGHAAKAAALLAGLKGEPMPVAAPPVPAAPPQAPMGTAMNGAPPAAPAPQQVMPAAAPPPQVSTVPPVGQGQPMSAYQRMMRNAVDRGTAPEAVQRAAQGGMPASAAPGLLDGVLGQGAQSAPGGSGAMPAASPVASMPYPTDPEGARRRIVQIQRLLTSPYAGFIDTEPLQSELKFLLEQSKPPEPMKPVVVGGRLVNPETGAVVYEAPPEPVKPMEIDGNLVDPSTGRVIYAAPQKPEKPPAGVQEYEYAKQQGFPGTFQDWEASKRGGMSLQVDPATGQVTFQQGGNIKPMTEAQSKDTVFATRARGALERFEPVAGALTSLPERASEMAPMGLGNYLQSPEYQKAAQAGKEFLQAILRKDTGAAITAQETAEYGTVYLPRPGDTPEVMAQKAESRKRAITAIEAGMPPQAILAQEKALRGTSGPLPPQSEPPPQTVAPQPLPLPPSTQRPGLDLDDRSTYKAGDIIDGFRFKGGDPADESNYEMVQ